MGRQDRVSGNSYTSLASTRRSRETACCGGFNVFTTAVLADLHEQLKAFYSEIGRPSVDTELMIRMLLVGYCYGIHHERRLRQEVELHLAYRTAVQALPTTVKPKDLETIRKILLDCLDRAQDSDPRSSNRRGAIYRAACRLDELIYSKKK
jgi:hypothetical protein